MALKRRRRPRGHRAARQRQDRARSCTSRPSTPGVGTIVVDNLDELALLIRLLSRNSSEGCTAHVNHNPQGVLIQLRDRARGLARHAPVDLHGRAEHEVRAEPRRRRTARSSCSRRTPRASRWTACTSTSAPRSWSWGRSASALERVTAGAGHGLSHLQPRRGPGRRLRPARLPRRRSRTTPRRRSRWSASSAGPASAWSTSPGRALTAELDVRHALHGAVREARTCRRWVAVDGGMSGQPAPDALRRPSTRSQVADRFGGEHAPASSPASTARAATCSSADARLDDPRPRRRARHARPPAPTAHSMANTYNGQPPPAGGGGRRRRRAPRGPP